MSGSPAGGPPRRPAGGPPPPGARKGSQAALNPGANPRFYDGPTVGSKTNDVKGKAKEAAKIVRSEVKNLPKRAARTARRHPWSFVSLLTTIPFLITISLFSSVFCPPPSQTPSLASQYLLQPFGFGHASAQQSELMQTLCYPSNVYHREFLDPYIYPVIDNVQDRLAAHPLYASTVRPAYEEVVNRADRIWKEPVRPIVRRIQRALRKAYLTFIHPHVPYIRARAYGLTAPYTSRVSALHQQHVAPHIATANSYAQAGAKNAYNNYQFVAAHPYTKEAGRRANQGYQIGKKRSWEAYEWGKPHAERAGREGQRILEQVVGPRVSAGVEWATVRIHLLYRTYLEPTLGPHIQTASRALQPYTAALHKHVYIPFIRPAIEAVIPMTVFAPEKPKTFWSLLADILPDSGGVEGKSRMKKTYEQAKQGAGGAASTASRGAAKASKSISSAAAAAKGTGSNVVKEAKNAAYSAVDKASKSVSSASKDVAATASTGREVKTRDDVNKAIKALETKVEQRGRAAHDNVRKELVAYYSKALSDKDQWVAVQTNGVAEIDRDAAYVISGLDKLYTTSTSLDQKQVTTSAQQAEARIADKVRKVKLRVDNMRKKLVKNAEPVVKLGTDELDSLREKEVNRLAEEMKAVDGVSTKEWGRITNLRKSLDEWENKINGLQEGNTADKQFSDASVSLPKAVASLNTHLDDQFEAFRDHLTRIKKTALDRVEAREAIASDSAAATSSHTAEKGKATILPVAEAAADAGGAILSKGKDQILDAYSQMAEVVSASTDGTILPSDSIDASATLSKASQSVSSVTNDAAGSIKSATQAATDSAISVGSVLSEGASSVGAVISETASSLASEATEAAHTAYKSAASAIGIDHTPDGAAEHLESIANIAAQGYASVVQQASGAVHDATRSAIRAVGATPSPEGVGEHIESLAARGAESVDSAVSVLSQAVDHGAASASSVVHDATRTALKAVGATPSPEGLAEHAESIAAVVGDSASSAASVVSASAGSVLDDVASSGSSVYSEIANSASSVYDAAAASGSSAADAAASAVHDATRSAMRAVGATPSPETPHEHAESILDAASSAVDSGTSALASQASELAGSVSSLLASITARAAPAATDAPLLASASAYLASLAQQGSMNGQQALSSGSSILLSLQNEASKTIHEAARAASRAVGATPSPETPGEYVELAKEKVLEAGRRVREEL